jgi:hypothetical protein
MAASFTFDIMTSPDPCLKAVMSGSVVNNFSYVMEPFPTLSVNTFNRFTSSMPSCGPVKYSIVPSDPTVLPFLKVGGITHTLIIQSNKLEFTDTSSSNEITFGHPNDPNLVND